MGRALQMRGSSGGRLRVTLRPRIVLFNDADVLGARSLVDKAHRDCFIGNSVTAVVDVQPVIAGQAAAA